MEAKMFFSHGNRQSRGVAIFTTESSGLDVSNISHDVDGRWILGEISWNNETYSIASVYAPNDLMARGHFFDGLTDLINGNDNCIVGGDFNCDLDNQNLKDRSKTILHNVLIEKDLVDAWRIIYPENPGFTHFHKVYNKASRIDYVFTSSHLLNSTEGLSDHHVVNVRI